MNSKTNSENTVIETWQSAAREWRKHLIYIPAAHGSPARLIFDTQHLVPAPLDGVARQSNHIDIDPTPSAQTLFRIANDPVVGELKALGSALAQATETLAPVLEAFGIDSTPALELLRDLRSPRDIPTCAQVELMDKVGLACARVGVKQARRLRDNSRSSAMDAADDVERLHSLAITTFQSLVSLRELIRLPQGNAEAESLIITHPVGGLLRTRVQAGGKAYWDLKAKAKTNPSLAHALRNMEEELSRDCVELTVVESNVRRNVEASLVEELKLGVAALREAYDPLQQSIAGIVQKDGRHYCGGRWKGTDAVEVLISIAGKAVETKGHITPSFWLDGLSWEDLERDLKIDLAALRRQPVAREAHPSGRAPRADDHCVASMIKTSGGWIIRFQGSEVAFPSLLGMELLFQILQRKGQPADITKQEIDAQQLDDLKECSNSVQPVLDEVAEKSIRRRLKELTEDLKEANAVCNEDQVQAIESERDAILENLKSASGRSRGNPRTLKSEATQRLARAKSNLKAAMHQLQIDLPHLHAHIRKFTKPLFSKFPCYRPVPDVNWILTM